MGANVITVTPDAERLLVYMARVSSSNQDNPECAKLLRYLVEHQHWSPFEMVHAVIEINTTRAIAAQLLRHRSFSFQEFSQRYQAVADTPDIVPGRKQSEKNRQSSVDMLDTPEQAEWALLQESVYAGSMAMYERALEIGVAREQARMLLPLAIPTRLYMAGSLRSWIHYVQLRTQPDTQEEHRLIAEQIRDLLTHHFPNVAEALGWLAVGSES